MGSPFTSHFTKTIPVPGDEDQSVVIRKLAPANLRRAQKASQRQALDEIQAMGGMKAYRELFGKSDDDKKDDDVPDPLMLFDRGMLLEDGIISWTYGEVTRAQIDDLDDDVQEAIARDVLRFAKPSLFTTFDQQQEARKNASAPSIVH